MQLEDQLSTLNVTKERELIDEVRQQDLPESLLPLIEASGETGGDRDRFLWRWLYQLFPEFTLSCVDVGRAQHVREIKLLASMFVTVADVAETHDDRETFDEIVKVPLNHRSVDLDRQGSDSDVVRVILNRASEGLK